MKDRYPSPTAKKGKVLKGNSERGGEEEYVYCRQCGFVCKQNRDRRAEEGSQQGDGIVINVYTTYSDPEVKSGCPFCGSLKYI